MQNLQTVQRFPVWLLTLLFIFHLGLIPTVHKKQNWNPSTQRKTFFKSLGHFLKEKQVRANLGKEMGEVQVLPVSPVSMEQSHGEVESGYWDADPSPIPLLLSLLLPDLAVEVSQNDNKV